MVVHTFFSVAVPARPFFHNSSTVRNEETIEWSFDHTLHAQAFVLLALLACNTFDHAQAAGQGLLASWADKTKS